MKIRNILASLAVMPAMCAHAYPGVLKAVEEAVGRHTEVCSKYTTPDQQENCKQKDKEKRHAQERYWQQIKDKDKSSQPQFKQPATDKPSGLCFTRKATGEVVCPN
jgi:hypothetical protein